MTNKNFWKLVKPFLANKGGLSGNSSLQDILLVRDDKIITEDDELVETFNDHDIDIVEKSRGKGHKALQIQINKLVTKKS